MAMKIGTQLPSLEGATEWFGGTQAHAESETSAVRRWSISGQRAAGFAKRICRASDSGVMKKESRDCA